MMRESGASDNNESLTKLHIFLNKHTVVGKDVESNYTNMEPRRKYYIEDGEEYDKFMRLYRRAVADGHKFHITQKHNKIGYLIIDIDMKFDKKFKKKRLYTIEDVKDIVEVLNKNILRVLEVPKNKMLAFVSEKKAPNIRKNCSADGLHIVYPLFAMHIDTQYFILDKIVKDFEKNKILDAFPFIEPLNIVFDKGVIYNANWMLYDSCKPDSNVYKLTHIYKHVDNSIDFHPSLKLKKIADIKPRNLKEIALDKYPTRELYKLFNVRQFHTADLAEYKEKYDKEIIKDAINNPVKKNKEKKKVSEKNNDIESDSDDDNKSEKRKKNKAEKCNLMLENNPEINVITKGKLEDMHRAEELVKLLKDKRSSNRTTWINVGEALHGVDYRLLSIWIKFSKRCRKKFVKGECEKLWEKFGKWNYGIGSLYYWAKEDNPEAYKIFREGEIKELLMEGLSQTSYDVGKVVYEIWKNDYVCASIKHKDWFQFENHRWVPVEEAYTLDKKLSEELADKYSQLASDCFAKATLAKGFEKEKAQHDGSAAGKIVLKLKDNRYKDRIMAEARRLFFNPQFYDKIDENKDIMGFENGVYNFATKEFRDGIPEDYLTFSTKINCIPYDSESKRVKWVKNFLKQVQPVKNMRKYVKALLSSYLQGHNPDEKFHIWTGTGCFKRNTKIMLYSGQSINVQYIKIGDKIMGADGHPKVVVNLSKGRNYMYKVISKINDKEIGKYVVNGEHKLVLNCINNDIKVNNNIMSWYEWNLQSGKPVRIEKKYNKNKMDKIIVSDKYINKHENFIVPVEQWIKMLEDDKELGNIFGGYKKIIDTDDVDTLDLDPFVLGLWLHYGSSEHKTFINLDETSKKYLLEENVIDKEGQLTNEYYGLFNKNKLFDEHLGKFIPEKYLCSSINVRQQLIEGIESVSRITSVSSKSFAKSLCRLYNSIGKIAIIEKNKKYIITIDEAEQDADGIIDTKLEITKIKKAHFFGFEIQDYCVSKTNDDECNDDTYDDKTNNKTDKRFLLEDYTVVSNSNGKSKLLELFQHALGQYADTFPVSLITKKRKDADNASPQLAKSKGKRFCVFNEPEDDDKVYVGMMKELTGGDEVEARKLFKEPIKFRPQFKLLLVCNKLPHIPANDKGTWRRLRVVEFSSEFVDKPSQPNQFKIDRSLPQKLPKHAEAFMSILIREFHKYKENGLVEPKKVKAFTENYRQDSDVFLAFIKETYSESKGGKISINSMYQVFKNWHRMSYSSSGGTPTRRDMISYLEKQDYTCENGYFKGYIYKDSNVDKKKDLDN
jgi:P4 family phage/plasmid primase-like protien